MKDQSLKHTVARSGDEPVVLSCCKRTVTIKTFVFLSYSLVLLDIAVKEELHNEVSSNKKLKHKSNSNTVLRIISH